MNLRLCFKVQISNSSYKIVRLRRAAARWRPGTVVCGRRRLRGALGLWAARAKKTTRTGDNELNESVTN